MTWAESSPHSNCSHACGYVGQSTDSEYFSECFSIDANGMALCGNDSQEIYTE